MKVLSKWGEELRKEKEAKGIFYSEALINEKTAIIVENNKRTHIIRTCLAKLIDQMWEFGEWVELPAQREYDREIQ